MIGFDTETALIEPGIATPRLVCVSVGDENGERLYHASEALGVSRALMESEQELTAHNAAYDTTVLSAAFPELIDPIFQAYDEGRILCTRVREQLRLIKSGDLNYREDDPDSKTRVAKVKLDLASLARIHLREHVDKSSDTWRRRYAKLLPLPIKEWPLEAVSYALNDARLHRAVGFAQGPVWPEDRRQSTYDFALRLMAVWGVRTDGERVAVLRTALLDENARLEEGLAEAGLLRRKKDGSFSKDTTKIREWVTEFFDGRPPKTAKGNVKTDRETLALCTDHPVLVDSVKRDANVKLLSTYLAPMLGATDRPLCSQPNVLVATGRTSWKSPNLQNQPRLAGLRECFRPREGWVYVNADYDSLELRTLAQAQLDIVGASTLAERYQEDPDFDPHTAFACTLLEISYEEGMNRKAEGDSALLDWRQRAKAANFGYPGGMGARSFMNYAQGYGLDLTLQESTHLRDEWFRTWPEMRAYFRHVSALVDYGGELRQLRSGRIRGRVGFTDGANSYFQGMAADGAKAAMWLITKACYVQRDDPLFGCRPVVFVHDEFMLEAPAEKAEAASARLVELMIEGMSMLAPNVPIRAAPAILDRWYKSTRGLSKVDGVYTDGGIYNVGSGWA